MSHVTRRQLIKGAAASVAACNMGAFAAAGRYSQIGGSEGGQVKNIPGWMTLFQPTDSRINYLLDSYFPSYRTNPLLKALMPVTAVIRNGGRNPVRAYSFRWTINTAQEEKTVFSKMFVSSPSIYSSKIIGTGKNSILHPGQFAVLTPLFVCTASRYLKKGGISVSRLLSRDPDAATFVASIGSDNVYKVRRNAKIVKTAAFGDDTSSAEVYETSRNAERDAAQELKQLQRGGQVVDADVLLSQLNEMRGAAGDVSSTTDLYSRARLNYVTALISGTKKVSAQHMMANIDIVAARKVTDLTRKPRTHIYGRA